MQCYGLWCPLFHGFRTSCLLSCSSNSLMNTRIFFSPFVLKESVILYKGHIADWKSATHTVRLSCGAYHIQLLYTFLKTSLVLVQDHTLWAAEIDKLKASRDSGNHWNWFPPQYRPCMFPHWFFQRRGFFFLEHESCFIYQTAKGQCHLLPCCLNFCWNNVWIVSLQN